jgi:predicted TIM-barrel fold metal-dependent hydrolase
MDPSERKYRPALVAPNGAREERPVRSILDTGSARSYWLIDGKIRGLARTVLTARQWQELAEASGRAMEVTPASQSLENVEVRVQHMDQLGIDVQVVYPTIFIEQVTDKPEIEVALCASYNRWMADIWQQGHGRVRWMCVLPLLSMQDALDMLPWCKDNGAVGVFMRPIEGERLLHDPYFDRLYEAVSRLNLCLGVHVANANPRERDLLGQRVAWGGGFRIFLTCYTSDDIGYITRQAGAGVLMIGTDYGHQDMSVELDALRTLGERGDLDPVVAQKILDENPRALYGL